MGVLTTSPRFVLPWGTPRLLLNYKTAPDVAPPWGTTAWTTPSVAAPTPGSMLIAHVTYVTNAGGDPSAPITISDSLTHIWSEPVTQHSRLGQTADWLGHAFFEASNSSTSTFTVSVDTSAGDIYGWAVQVSELTGASAAAIGATGSVSATGDGAVNITLSAAPAATSVVVAGLGCYETTGLTFAITPGSGWNELCETGHSYPNTQTQYRTGSTSNQVDWSDNGTTVVGHLGLAFEVVR